MGSITQEEHEHSSSWIAWLEKQRDKNEEILVLKDQIESLHAAIKALKEAHKIELKKQGEQKPVDKVEPKFKYGDRVRNKKSGLEQTLGSCIEDVYEGAFPLRIKEQDEWELVD
jgi:phage host-nuclease inhibitor protein Gam